MRNAARAVLAASLLAAAVPAAALEGNVNVFAGQKWFSDAEWQPIETQPELGIQLAFGQLRAPIHFAVDVFHSQDESTIAETRVEGSTTEYALGVRKVFRRQATMHPHLGGGASLVAGDVTAESPAARFQADDSDFGFWIDGGITWRLGGHLNLGLEVRYSRVKLEFGNIFAEDKVPGGGFHAGALVGFGW
ncbi:MAG TPA: hypothetical protein VJ826_06875 [Candidatus Polarisedimenticolaceae bacterium]|nr:hypothetical protein [Candidatus Polarisedimenticolaceae bacterium]